MNRKLTLRRRGKPDILLEEYVPNDSIVTVGKDPGTTIQLDEADIAPEQFLMVLEEEEFVLMNRAEGTVLNGAVLSPGARITLSDGDLLEAGSYELAYTAPAAGLKTAGEQEVQTSQHGGPNSAAGTAAAKAALEVKKVMETESDIDLGSDAQTDFSKLLYDLREEDTFYFHLHDSEGSIQRVPFDSDEIWLGTKLGSVTVDPVEENIDEVFARVNKDWSGVVLYPRDDQNLLFDGKRLIEPFRLSNGDKLVLIDDLEESEMETTISFHEPVTLMALNSILPGELPEPVSAKSMGAAQARGIERENAYASPDGMNGESQTRLMFGYFTMLEILIMAVGTIIAAAIIFFVLEFV